ncbi:unnamed protein product [Amoebophrya sp. A120]|nr:unnamed protein product [Amoebophrya sp. A120]|eukprot:GSA120T00023593001.1
MLRGDPREDTSANGYGNASNALSSAWGGYISLLDYQNSVNTNARSKPPLIDRIYAIVGAYSQLGLGLRINEQPASEAATGTASASASAGLAAFPAQQRWQRSQPSGAQQPGSSTYKENYQDPTFAGYGGASSRKGRLNPYRIRSLFCSGKEKWVRQSEFRELLLLASSLPGVTIVQLTTSVAAVHAGLLGAVTGLALLVLPVALLNAVLGAVLSSILVFPLERTGPLFAPGAGVGFHNNHVGDQYQHPGSSSVTNLHPNSTVSRTVEAAPPLMAAHNATSTGSFGVVHSATSPSILHTDSAEARGSSSSIAPPMLPGTVVQQLHNFTASSIAGAGTTSASSTDHATHSSINHDRLRDVYFSIFVHASFVCFGGIALEKAAILRNTFAKQPENRLPLLLGFIFVMLLGDLSWAPPLRLFVIPIALLLVYSDSLDSFFQFVPWRGGGSGLDGTSGAEKSSSSSRSAHKNARNNKRRAGDGEEHNVDPRGCSGLGDTTYNPNYNSHWDITPGDLYYTSTDSRAARQVDSKNGTEDLHARRPDNHPRLDLRIDDDMSVPPREERQRTETQPARNPAANNSPDGAIQHQHSPTSPTSSPTFGYVSLFAEQQEQTNMNLLRGRGRNNINTYYANGQHQEDLNMIVQEPSDEQLILDADRDQLVQYGEPSGYVLFSVAGLLFVLSWFFWFSDSLACYGSHLRAGFTLFGFGTWIEAVPLLECENLVPKHIFLLGLVVARVLPAPSSRLGAMSAAAFAQSYLDYKVHKLLPQAIFRGVAAACCFVVPGVLLMWGCLPFWTQTREVLTALRPKIAKLHSCMAGLVAGATTLLMLQAINRADDFPASFKAALIIVLAGVRFWVENVKEWQILLFGGASGLLWHFVVSSFHLSAGGTSAATYGEAAVPGAGNNFHHGYGRSTSTTGGHAVVFSTNDVVSSGAALLVHSGISLRT